MNKIENLSTCTNLSIVGKINEIIDELNIPESVEIASGSVDRCLISGTSNFYSKLTIITENKSLLIFEITNYSNTKEIKNIFIESIDSTDQTYLKTNSNKEFIYLDQSGDIRISYPNKCNILFDGISGDYNEIAPSDSRVTTPVASTKPNQWGLYVPHGVELGKDSDLDANKQTVTVNDSWVTITNQYDNNAKAYNYAIAFDRTKIKTFVYDLCDALNTAVEGILQVIGNRDDSTGDTIWANINRLDGELDTVSGDITNINSSIQNINSSISNINTELTQVGDQVSQNTTNITELTQRVDEIYLDDGEGNVTGLLQDAIDKNNEQDDRLDSLESRVDGHDDDIEGIRTDIRNLQLSNSYMVSMSHEDDYTRISRVQINPQDKFAVEYNISTDNKDQIQFVIDNNGIQLINLTNNSYKNFERFDSISIDATNLDWYDNNIQAIRFYVGSESYSIAIATYIYYYDGFVYIGDNYMFGYFPGVINWMNQNYDDYVNYGISQYNDRRNFYKLQISKSDLETLISNNNLGLVVAELTSESDLWSDHTYPKPNIIPIEGVVGNNDTGELVIYEPITDSGNSFIDVYLKRYDSTNDTTVSVDILNNISTNLKTVTSNYKDYTDFDFDYAKELRCNDDFLHNIDPVIVTDESISDVTDEMDNVANYGPAKYGRKIKIPKKSQTFPLKVHDVSKGSSASGYETEYNPSSAAQTVNALSEVKVTDGSGLTGNGTNSSPLNIDSTNLEFNPNQFDVVPDQVTNKTEISIKSSAFPGIHEYNLTISSIQGAYVYVLSPNTNIADLYELVSSDNDLIKLVVHTSLSDISVIDDKVFTLDTYDSEDVSNVTNYTIGFKYDVVNVGTYNLVLSGTSSSSHWSLTLSPVTKEKTLECTITESSGNYSVSVTYNGNAIYANTIYDDIVNNGAKYVVHVQSAAGQVNVMEDCLMYLNAYKQGNDYWYVAFRYDKPVGGAYLVNGYYGNIGTTPNWSLGIGQPLQAMMVSDFPATVDTGIIYVI